MVLLCIRHAISHTLLVCFLKERRPSGGLSAVCVTRDRSARFAPIGPSPLSVPFKVPATCVRPNFLWRSAFCTLFWASRAGAADILDCVIDLESSSCTPCPSLSVEINDACFWPCIKIWAQAHTHYTHTCVCIIPPQDSSLVLLICFAAVWLGTVPSMNIPITWLL